FASLGNDGLIFRFRCVCRIGAPASLRGDASSRLVANDSPNGGHMSLLPGACVTALMLAVSLAACSDSKDSVGPGGHSPAGSTPASTLGTGSTATLLGRATFADATNGPFEIVRTMGSHWSVDVKADPNFDLAVQNIMFEPGGQSGWHSHPGPVF